MMDIFNKAKVAELESVLETYRSRNKQLEKFKGELKDAQLKIKIMQMLIDDDKAVLELLAAEKNKESVLGQQRYFDSIRSQQIVMGSAGGYGVQGQAALSRLSRLSGEGLTAYRLI